VFIIDSLKFLQIIYEKANIGYLSIWTLQDKHTAWFPATKLDAAAVYAESRFASHDVYFGVGLRGEALGDKRRGYNDDVTAITAFWADIDIKGPAHKETALPETTEAALAFLDALPHQPSIVVSSGHGLHVYWLFDEPIEVTDSRRSNIEDAMIGWQRYVNAKARERGWVMDSVSDLARVLRVPGGLNHKLPGETQNVVVAAVNEVRYLPSDFSPYVQRERKSRVAVDFNGKVGPADVVIEKCAFIKYCKNNAARLPEPNWHAMVSNIALCSDGPARVHELSRPYPGYNFDETQDKIDRALAVKKPHTCTYIQDAFGFDCGGCDAGCKAPVALAVITRADEVKALLEANISDWSNIFSEEYISALSYAKAKMPGEYAQFRIRLPKKVSLRELDRCIKLYDQKQRRERTGTPLNLDEIPDDQPIFEHDGRYFRMIESKDGQGCYPITNFVFRPGEMLMGEDETQITADAVTTDGVQRLTLMTADFSNINRFKNVLNKHTLGLGFTGSEDDLEFLKVYLHGQAWDCKTGVKAVGIYKHEGRWVFVSGDKATGAGGVAVNDIVQLEKHREIKGDILGNAVISPDDMKALGAVLYAYNEPAKTVAITAWAAGCFVKEHLRELNIKYPHLALIGEAGSGKSSTGEDIILPIFGMKAITAAPQVTEFTLMQESASSKLIPQVLDEFKPSTIYRTRLSALYNHLRNTYDGLVGRRGRADLSVAAYPLSAPLVIIGEESPGEAAIRERCIELLFSKKDIKIPEYRASFEWLCSKSGVLGAFGRGLLETALCTKPSQVNSWYNDSLESFDRKMPSRVVNNLQCCAVGLRLVEKLCETLGLKWADVFRIPINECFGHLNYGAREYLLDGKTYNKGIIEQTLEIMARMGLNDKCEWKKLKDGNAAILFDRVYDRYTAWRRDHDIKGECLNYEQFKKQLRHSDLFVEYKAVAFDSGTVKAHVLDFPEILRRCDLTDFSWGVEPF